MGQIRNGYAGAAYGAASYAQFIRSVNGKYGKNLSEDYGGVLSNDDIKKDSLYACGVSDLNATGCYWLDNKTWDKGQFVRIWSNRGHWKREL